jgi:hypothetical protein
MKNVTARIVGGVDPGHKPEGSYYIIFFVEINIKRRKCPLGNHSIH